MTNEDLKCPKCHAGVASTSSRCQFCYYVLRTTTCTICSGLIFVGVKFCEHCGAIAAPATLAEKPESGLCPRCTMPLVPVNIGLTELRECIKCKGLWSGFQTFEDICTDPERQFEILRFVAQRKTDSEVLTKVRYIRCPDCSATMNRSSLARANGVIVDFCKNHGLWFESSELPKILDMVGKGATESTQLIHKLEIISEREQQGHQHKIPDNVEENPVFRGGFEMAHDVGITNFVKRLFS